MVYVLYLCVKEKSFIKDNKIYRIMKYLFNGAHCAYRVGGIHCPL